MKPFPLQLPRLCVTLICAIGLTCSLHAQSRNGDDRPAPGGDLRPTIPSAEKLTRFGQVATAAEAKPLIERYYSEQEQLFQERRAAILQAKGKSPEEQLKIMQAVVASQRDRRQKNRELETRLGAMLKQDREGRQHKKTTDGKGP